jgi:hypothetical protein
LRGGRTGDLSGVLSDGVAGPVLCGNGCAPAADLVIVVLVRDMRVCLSGDPVLSGIGTRRHRDRPLFMNVTADIVNIDNCYKSTYDPDTKIR